MTERVVEARAGSEGRGSGPEVADHLAGLFGREGRIPSPEENIDP